ncbi:MAG TPA: HlyD family efflux transporter periplasmic adaptor subunit [Anaerolineaceae bacterium]|jgi:HlyD family secretion protein
MTHRWFSTFVILAFFLAGCAKATPAPIPTLAVTPSSGGGTPVPSDSGAVTASAEIVPAQSADLSFAAIAIVQEIKVHEGDSVHAGDVLASQDNLSQLQAAVDASQAALTTAQATYDSLVTNAPVARANAELTLATAQKTFDDAKKAVASKQFQRATQQTIDIARANLIVANKALDDAETIYNQNKNRSSTDVVFAAALAQLAAAQQRQQSAQYNLNYVSSLPDPLSIQTAQANLDVAQANLDAAQAASARVKDGPDPDTAAADQAQIAGAKATLSAAQSALAHATLKAPFDGTVVAVSASAGEAVNPGQVVLTLASLKAFQVETTDLSERDVNRVSLGQPVTISVPGLSKDFPGKVTRIAQRATKVGGDTVYKVTIAFDAQPGGLLWGMSANVRIGG